MKVPSRTQFAHTLRYIRRRYIRPPLTPHNTKTWNAMCICVTAVKEGAKHNNLKEFLTAIQNQKKEIKMSQLTLGEMKHLLKLEPTKADALELIAIQAERKQITPETEQELNDWVCEVIWAAPSQD